MNTILREVFEMIKLKIFIFAERYLKIHITAVHFYSPIPNVSELRDEVYEKQNNCEGLELIDQEYFDFMKLLFVKYNHEYTPLANSGLSQVDSFILYSIIREKKPEKMIEIGSGESTQISLSALSKNEKEGANCNFIAIEPFPNAKLKEIFSKNFNLLEKQVQDVSLDNFFDTDILFIDSSHVAKIGSDVNYEILCILPVLKVGAFVHWHDIMIPIDYSKAWIQSGKKFWNESYMVHCFMLYNKCFKIIFPAKYMQIMHSDKMINLFPYYSSNDQNQQLSSFWIQRIS